MVKPMYLRCGLSRRFVFTSIQSHDIDLARVKSQGAAVLKTFLQYAETGLLEVAGPTGIAARINFRVTNPSVKIRNVGCSRNSASQTSLST